MVGTEIATVVIEPPAPARNPPTQRGGPRDHHTGRTELVGVRFGARRGVVRLLGRNPDDDPTLVAHDEAHSFDSHASRG